MSYKALACFRVNRREKGDFYFMIDYKLKSKVLKTDICKQLKQIDYKTYDNAINGIVNDEKLDNEYLDVLFQYGHEYVKEARKINLASFQKTKRLRRKIEKMLTNSPCLWITLTFKDSVLETTREDTRRQYVRKYLKNNYPDYIANIDYGSINEREHYHAIIATNNINLREWHQYGAIKVEHIRVNKQSEKRLPKYITKLTNHAIKETTKRCHIIYSRTVVK